MTAPGAALREFEDEIVRRVRGLGDLLRDDGFLALKITGCHGWTQEQVSDYIHSERQTAL